MREENFTCPLSGSLRLWFYGGLRSQIAVTLRLTGTTKFAAEPLASARDLMVARAPIAPKGALLVTLITPLMGAERPGA